MANQKLIEYIAKDAEHHPMGPSGADRWMVCPASVRDSMGIYDEGSDAAREGTIAHELAEKCLERGLTTAAYVDFISDHGREDTPYDHHMIYYVQQYLDYLHEHAKGAKIHGEKTLDLSAYIPYGKGTSDAIWVTEEDV